MNKEFEVHKPNEQGFAKVTELAHGFDALLTASTLCSPLRRFAHRFDALLTAIIAWIPASRELSIVRTKLEEACFFAKKGIANVPENQQ
jgi:hypothetical protein